MNVLHYISPEGRDLYQEWLDGLTDLRGRAAIFRRIERLQGGNFGDCRFCGDGVWELRVDVGPGYRVYYAKSGESVILILCGGDKRTQARDIRRAIATWKTWQETRQ